MTPFRIVDENLRAAMRCYERVSARGESRDYAGMALTSCGINYAVFNSAMLTAPASEKDLRCAVSLGKLHFASRALDWSFWLCDDWLTGRRSGSSREIFREHGLSLVARPPGMYAEEIAPAVRPLASLDVRPIVDERTRIDFAHISSITFSLPFQSARDVYGSAELWKAPMYGWVAYVRDNPVAVVTVVIAAGAAGVYSLGTLPQHQRCGYGEALMRHALEELRNQTGITRSVLQSTDCGFNLYLRMGYRIVTRFSVFTG